MYLAQIALSDLAMMYKTLGNRLFERNVRYGLSAGSAPNRSLHQALVEILVKRTSDADALIFRHNGVTIAAERVELIDGGIEIFSPRVLNGAQTITTLDRVLSENTVSAESPMLRETTVLAKIIVATSPEFITEVTISNNRQNPVNAISLRACDDIQVRLEDHFRDTVRIFYERQDRAYEAHRTSELEDRTINVGNPKPINIRRFAQTLLAAKGDIDRMSHVPAVFESQTQYTSIFNNSLFDIDPRRLVVAYKVGLRLGLITKNLVAQVAQMQFLSKAGNALWVLTIRGLWNRNDFEDIVARYGNDTSVEASFTDVLNGIVDRIGPSMRKVVREHYKDAENGKTAFWNTKTFVDRCLKELTLKNQWNKRPL